MQGLNPGVKGILGPWVSSAFFCHPISNFENASAHFATDIGSSSDPNPAVLSGREGHALSSNSRDLRSLLPAFMFELCQFAGGDCPAPTEFVGDNLESRVARKTVAPVEDIPSALAPAYSADSRHSPPNRTVGIFDQRIKPLPQRCRSGCDRLELAVVAARQKPGLAAGPEIAGSSNQQAGDSVITQGWDFVGGQSYKSNPIKADQSTARSNP
jgi:hypothetical protein